MDKIFNLFKLYHFLIYFKKPTNSRCTEMKESAWCVMHKSCMGFKAMQHGIGPTLRCLQKRTRYIHGRVHRLRVLMARLWFPCYKVIYLWMPDSYWYSQKENYSLHTLLLSFPDWPLLKTDCLSTTSRFLIHWASSYTPTFLLLPNYLLSPLVL